ncbi:putative glycolipid-binding domain-containing protein [Leifsonia shinshuensis]|uniref:putative glycolipid-binding domain-containing protein n=1 Tax=Leifsonia shinshuensis TaxID=150026 RepID=UPI00285F8315|nr:putative glycolipid-binding domain-containing protein [Leifsonia shinshuensis]MDR6972016.1 hypothetical protein [Leifsonia shinshuensis]
MSPEPPRRYCWIGLDDASRFDIADLRFGESSLTAQGTSLTSAYAAAWTLDVGPGWITRRITVTVAADTWRRSLELTMDARGAWAAHPERSTGGPAEPPGLTPGASLADAVDCDLGLCPVTNTMPIRRLGLLRGDVAPTRIATAWVEVPSLRVVRSEQVYASQGGVITFRTGSGDFTADLVTDELGVVTHYPGLATGAVPPAAS